MDIYTVTKPGGTKDFEFEAYTRLLEDIGVDVANVPRIPEPGTHRRWLYTWQRKEEAEGFARELNIRTRDSAWYVYPSKADRIANGPVAPLDIVQARQNEEFMYYLSPGSRERIIRAHPHTPVKPSVTLSQGGQAGQQCKSGPVLWDELAAKLTGLQLPQILALGGYRVILPGGEIGHEALPEIPVHA